MFFDYYDVIKQPMTINAIKRRIGKDTSFNLDQLYADMHLVWDNARLYNQEGSWVFNAADDMQEFFDKLWAEEVPKFQSTESASSGTDGGGAGGGVGNGGSGGLGSELASGAPSGTSTPMYKPQDKVVPVPPKIKISMGGRKRMAEVEPDPTPTQSEESDEEDDDDDDDDDDY